MEYLSGGSLRQHMEEKFGQKYFFEKKWTINRRTNYYKTSLLVPKDYRLCKVKWTIATSLKEIINSISQQQI
jgi:hypothetical protein